MGLVAGPRPATAIVAAPAGVEGIETAPAEFLRIRWRTERLLPLFSCPCIDDTPPPCWDGVLPFSLTRLRSCWAP